MSAETRLLGLDVGRQRIGVAVSDALGMLAWPQGVVAVGADEGIGEICALAEHLAAVRIIVGLPLSLSGEGGEEAQRVEAWAERLRTRTALPVELWDERLSTVAAERTMLEAGMRRGRRRRQRDAVAAALILQSYLDAHRTDTEGE